MEQCSYQFYSFGVAFHFPALYDLIIFLKIFARLKKHDSTVNNDDCVFPQLLLQTEICIRFSVC